MPGASRPPQMMRSSWSPLGNGSILSSGCLPCNGVLPNCASAGKNVSGSSPRAGSRTNDFFAIAAFPRRLDLVFAETPQTPEEKERRAGMAVALPAHHLDQCRQRPRANGCEELWIAPCRQLLERQRRLVTVGPYGRIQQVDERREGHTDPESRRRGGGASDDGEGAHRVVAHLLGWICQAKGEIADD